MANSLYMSGNLVTIVKDGKLINTDEDNLRKDDIVVFQVGDIVPADLHLVEERGLVVDDFEITGEILPVHKRVNNEAVNLYMGSKVMRGTGRGVIIATGEESEYGKILKQKRELILPPPIQIIQSRYLLLVGLLLPAFGIHIARSQAGLWPVALYVMWSVVLILLQNDHLFRHILVRREIQQLAHLGIYISDPAAFERLWQMDLLCFDKTGVLTTRGLKVKQLYLADRTVDAEGVVGEQLEESAIHQLKIACALCHDILIYEKIDQANPVDQALSAFAEKQNVVLPELWAQYERIYDVPFDPENRSMVCGYRRAGRVIYYTKGDPNVVLSQCKDYLTASGERKKVDMAFWHFTSSVIDSITQNGDTAIALACASDLSDQPGRAFTFLCLVQLKNTLQPGAREVVQGLKEKGIRVLLLTGDRPKTAISVSQACGISEGSQACLAGREVDAIGSAEVVKQSQYCSVFARLSPSQKGYLILLFQQKGHCVGMVGDGPNDGIALKVADIGISFSKNSSLIARRLSKILLPELVDLLALVEGAYRVRWRAKILKAFRLLIIAGSLASAYIWIMSELC